MKGAKTKFLPLTIRLVNYVCRFGKNVKIVHFIGAGKPWKTCFDGSGEPILGI